MSILDPASSHSSLIIEIFFETVHYNRSGKSLLEKAAGAEIALEVLSDAFICIFPDCLYDPKEELRPVTFIHAASDDGELLLALVADKCCAEFLGVVIDIFGEPEHDDQPEVVRLDHNIAVVHVGLVEAVEKSISSGVGQLAVLRIGQQLPIPGPELLPRLLGHPFRLLSF